MQTIVKALFILILIIVISSIFLYFYYFNTASQTTSATQEQATSIIYNSLQNTYPSAQINITNVTPSYYQGNWDILAKVIINSTSPCPSYFLYSFVYPKNGTTYTTVNTYTNNCIIYGNTNNTTSITSAPAAITQSYDLKIPSIMTFVQKYGYSSVAVHAAFYNKINYQNNTYTDIWFVYYFAPDNSSISVLISSLNGTAYAINSASILASVSLTPGIYNLTFTLDNNQTHILKRDNITFTGQQIIGVNSNNCSIITQLSSTNNTNESNVLNNNTTYTICKISFSGLAAFTNYNLSINGTTRAYCPKTSICPDIDMLIHTYKVIKTKNYGTTSIVLFNI